MRSMISDIIVIGWRTIPTYRPYYYAVCLSRLHNIRSSSCHSLYYDMQIHKFINADSSSDQQSTLPVLWFRVVPSAFFFTIPKHVNFLTSDWIGTHQWKSLDSNHFASSNEICQSNFDVQQPTFFGLNDVVGLNNLAIGLRVLRSLCTMMKTYFFKFGSSPAAMLPKETLFTTKYHCT